MKKKIIVPLTEEQRQAAANLYAEYKGLMIFTAKKLTNIPAEIDDLLQDSLVALLKNISTISGLDCYKTAAYIVLTIRRTYFNHIKKDNQALLLPLEEEMIQSTDATSFFAEASALDSDDKLDVMFLMDALSPDDRMILEAWYLEGCSAEQLAQRLDCKPSSIRMILSRVRKRAANLLKSMEVKN